jgi:hypothetical protein
MWGGGMRGLWLVVVLAAGLGSGSALAQTVTLTFVSDGSGIGLSGSGTDAASMSLGTVQAFGGMVPSGVSEQADASSFTLSTPIGVEVMVSGFVSPSYTLTGQLLFSDLRNTWKINSVTLSTSASTITNSGAYGLTASTFSLTVPFSAAGGSISNTISFTVTSN